MRLVKIGTASVSVKVGDFATNTARLEAAIDAARAEGVHLLVTPELGISGYSLEDRIYWADIARESWRNLERLAEKCVGISAFLGLPVRIDSQTYNAAAFVSDGEIHGLVLKRVLPTYSIFYEGRNWTAWEGGVTTVHGVPAGDLVFKTAYGKVSAEICEDLWSTASPAMDRVAAGAEIICNPSASPFVPRKNEDRKRLVVGSASNMKTVYAYANLLGCDNSRLVFDGGGMIATPDGIAAEGEILSKRWWTLTTGVVDLGDLERMRVENTTWRQGSKKRAGHEPQVVPVDGPAYTPAKLTEFAESLPKSFYVPEVKPRTHDRNPALDELFDALVLGLRDYFEKVGAFERFLVALSGGRDSALCLMIAVEAAKALKEGAEADRYADRVSTVYLPTKAYSSDATLQASKALAEELGVPFRVVPIDDGNQIALSEAEQIMGGPDKVTPIARQNIQARVRGALMLNWGNSAGGLVLVTSNLSEMAVGYSTTGGDNQGGYSPIANVPKSLCTDLLAYLADRDDIKALHHVLAIPPSAELADDQEDEKDLMPYVVLDDLLYCYARKRMELPDCWRVVCARHPNHDPEQLRAWTADFARRFAFNQWKRDQHPVALKVMDLDLDPKTGFRFPVSQSIAHELQALDDATLDG
jgi:NAD+ synthase (glutamine-hydrolysing)